MSKPPSKATNEIRGQHRVDYLKHQEKIGEKESLSLWRWIEKNRHQYQKNSSHRHLLRLKLGPCGCGPGSVLQIYSKCIETADFVDFIGSYKTLALSLNKIDNIYISFIREPIVYRFYLNWKNVLQTGINFTRSEKEVGTKEKINWAEIAENSKLVDSNKLKFTFM